MKRILRSIYGQYVGTVDDFRLASQKGLITGPWGNQMPLGDLQNYVNFDDFDGAAILGTWGVLKGTDAAAANFAINGGVSGTVLGTTGATTTTMAGSGIQISGHLNAKAQGAGSSASTNNLEFSVRVQLSAITNLVVFVGLTNQVASLQMPIQGSGVGNAFTGNANDAVGFVFDTTMTTKDWWMIGNKAGTLAIGQDTISAPVAATYDVLAVSVDQLGNANFFQNGNQVGVTMPNAVTPTVALAPCIAAFNRTGAASRNVTLDYIMMSMNRI
ncbi:MAG: hypothetical protein ACRETS_04880 [Steroidobacteraceae bacterium]